VPDHDSVEERITSRGTHPPSSELVSSPNGVERRLSAARAFAWPSLALLLLTSVHHVYGAYRYATPERFHVLFIAVPAAIVIACSLRLLRSRGGGVAFWVLAATSLVVAVLLFGVYEGGYNHVLKNVLYFAGTAPEVMRTFFPYDMYEPPNDVVFEVTGVAQAVVAAIAGQRLTRLLGECRRVSLELSDL
jgi:hypothetical protein